MAVEERHTRVLIIVDDPDRADPLAARIAESGRGRFPIDRARTLREGLDRLGAERVDVVLLDLFLPDSRDLDTLRAVICRHPGAPVVVVTGVDDEALGTRVVQAGAQDVVATQDVSGAPLAAMLRHAIERHRLRRSLELNAARAEASLHRFRNVFERTADGIVVMDDHGRILAVNPSAERMLGATSDELAGDVFPVEIAVGERKVHETRPNGETRRIETHVTKTVWGGKRARLASMRDVSERVRLAGTASAMPDIDDDW